MNLLQALGIMQEMGCIIETAASHPYNVEIVNPHGLTISVGFGAGHYCSNRHMDGMTPVEALLSATHVELYFLEKYSPVPMLAPRWDGIYGDTPAHLLVAFATIHPHLMT